MHWHQLHLLYGQLTTCGFYLELFVQNRDNHRPMFFDDLVYKIANKYIGFIYLNINIHILYICILYTHIYTYNMYNQFISFVYLG